MKKYTIYLARHRTKTIAVEIDATDRGDAWSQAEELLRNTTEDDWNNADFDDAEEPWIDEVEETDA